MEILGSARKHGVLDDDIRHAIENALGALTSPARPDFTMLIGPDQALNMLEVGVMVADDDEFVVHAMKARAIYLRALGKD